MINESMPSNTFDPKTTLKIQKCLQKLLVPAKNPLSFSSLDGTSRLAKMSSDNVYMVIALSDAAKSLFCPFIDSDVDFAEMARNLAHIDRLSFIGETGIANTCRYNVRLLKDIFSLFASMETKHSSESVAVEMKQDYPISISNAHFKVILAPRVEND